MKKTVLLIIISAFIVFNCQLTAQISDSTLKWKELMDSTELYKKKNDWKTALQFAEKAFIQAEKQFKVLDTNYINSLMTYEEMLVTKISTVFNDNDTLSRLKAIEFGKKDTLLTYNYYGENHPKHLEALMHLSIAYWCNQKYDDTRIIIIEIANLLEDKNEKNYLEIITNSGTLSNLFHLDSISMRLLFKAKAIIETNFGKKSKEYLNILITLSDLNMKLFKYNESEQFLKEALSINEYSSEKDNSLEIDIYSKLFNISYNQGQYTDAKALISQYLVLIEKNGNLNDDKYLNGLKYLIQINLALDDNINECEQLYKKILDINLKYKGKNSPEYVRSILDIATFYKNQKLYVESEKYFLEHRRIVKELEGEISYNYIENMLLMGTFYRNQGRNLDYFHENEEAVKLSSELFNKNKSLPNKHILITSYNTLAISYVQLNQYQKADTLYKIALEYYYSVAKTNGEGYYKCLIDYCFLLRKMKRFQEIENYYLEIVKYYRNKNGVNHKEYLSKLQQLAIVFYDKKDYNKAIDTINSVLRIYSKEYGEENSQYLVYLNTLAAFYKDNGNNNSLDSINQIIQDISYKIDVKNKDYFSIKEILCNLLNEKKKFKESEEILLDLIKQIKQMKPNNYTSYVFKLAKFYKTQGRLTDAEILLNEIINLDKDKIGANSFYILSLEFLAEVYRDLGLYDKSEPFFVKSLELIRTNEGERSDTYIAALHNYCTLMVFKDEQKKADSIMKQIIELVKELKGENSIDYAQHLDTYASILTDQGYLKTAIVRLNQALEIFNSVHYMENSVPATLNNLSLAYYKQKDFVNAYKYIQKSISATNNINGKYNYRSNPIYHNLALISEIQNDNSKSDSAWLESLDLNNYLIANYFPSLSDFEKEQFFKSISKFFEQFYSYAVKRYERNPKIKSDLYDIILSVKGLLLESSQKVRNSIINSNDEDLKQTFKIWQNIRADISGHISKNNNENESKNITLDSLQNLSNSLEKELSRKSIPFSKEFDKKIIKRMNIVNNLNENEAAVEIIRFRGRNLNEFNDSVFYTLLLIKGNDKNNTDLILLPNGNDLEEKYYTKYNKMIRDLGEDYRNGSKMWTDIYINNSLKDMYVNFWQKIQEKLVGVKTVYLSVDGVYNKINLNTLINPETGKYLAEELDLRIVTSTRDLVNRNIIADNILSGNKSAELFGSPKFNLDSNEIQDISQKYAVNKQSIENSNSNNKLSRGLSDTLLRGLGYDELPGTKIEIEKISDILKSQGWNSKIYIGKDATEEAVKSVNSPKILHIATHGQFDRDNETSQEQKKLYENPLLKSKLILAGGENTRLKLVNNESVDSGTEDGYLTAYEVMNMNLDNTELVVLSACETGLGEIRNGEGVYGLQRAFQVAGAKSLIMSLWKVPDAPTQELMLSFYSKWLGGMDKREAFRQSQMELAKNYPNFFYWGAFEIITNY
jgi:CHAT domain-containing protein